MKNKPKKDYQVAPVRLPPELKKRVRIHAAERDICMADMAEELINAGLSVYEKMLENRESSEKASFRQKNKPKQRKNKQEKEATA